MSVFYIYILRTSSNTLYVGQTNNLEKRVGEHKTRSKKSAKYLKYFSNVELVYSEEYKTRSLAMKREAEIKSWTKIKKEELLRQKKA